MTTKRIKQHLYHNPKTDTYFIHYGTKISIKTLEEAEKIYQQLEHAQWLPSKCIPIMEANKRYNSKIKKIKTYKQKGKVTLYLKGFYIETGQIPQIKKTIQEYIKTNYNDTFIDYKRTNLRKNKAGNMPLYISQIGKNQYRISRNINKKTYYYGLYKTLEEAEKKVQQLHQTGWKPPKRKRKQYNTSKETRYIQQQPSTKHYFIVKQGEYFGTYKTLKEAQEERDWLIENNWNYDNVDLY